MSNSAREDKSAEPDFFDVVGTDVPAPPVRHCKSAAEVRAIVDKIKGRKPDPK
jgi:hypothetical protein